MKQRLFTPVALAAAIAFAGCTMHEQETPDLSGPSEYGTSIAIAAERDILTQDGFDNTTITIKAFKSNGSPQDRLNLRAEIQVGGARADTFGSLSQRTMMTDSNGQAKVIYTAPKPTAVPVGDGTIVDIVITPEGTDFNNTVSRRAAILVVPPGSVVAPIADLQAIFTFTPKSPNDSEPVLFDASESKAAAGSVIASYTWDFGDGASGFGVSANHKYASAGIYVVKLTISDSVGRSAQTSATVTVSAGVNPTAAFTSSPGDPLVNQPVNFNASASRAAPGRTIKSYDWDFGDRTFGSGITPSHPYAAAHAYVATLTVTDDTGKKGTATGTVTVK
jgi:PKD repeat protein